MCSCKRYSFSAWRTEEHDERPCVGASSISLASALGESALMTLRLLSPPQTRCWFAVGTPCFLLKYKKYGLKAVGEKRKLPPQKGRQLRSSKRYMLALGELGSTTCCLQTVLLIRKTGNPFCSARLRHSAGKLSLFYLFFGSPSGL